MQQWKTTKTPLFLKSIDRLSISPKVIEGIDRWATTATLVPTNSFIFVYRSPNNKFEIWVARIPDPDHRKGTSGGFRLLCAFVRENNDAYLHYIERRAAMGGRERPKEQQTYETHLSNFKQTLLDTFDPPTPDTV